MILPPLPETHLNNKVEKFYTAADMANYGKLCVTTICGGKHRGPALDFWKNGHIEMTSELFAARRANDTAVDEYIKCEEKVIALTAERDYWRAYAGSSDHFYKVMSEGLTAERDAFKIAANRYETVRKMNARQFVELYRANIEQGMLFDDLVDNFCIAKEKEA